MAAVGIQTGFSRTASHFSAHCQSASSATIRDLSPEASSTLLTGVPGGASSAHAERESTASARIGVRATMNVDHDAWIIGADDHGRRSVILLVVVGRVG